jgi:hypothetical protein
MARYLPILILVFSQADAGKIAVSAACGMSHGSSHTFAYSVYAYYKFDEQILLGLHGGQQQGGIPMLGSLYMRLPLGSVFMPFVIGDIGYFWHEDNPGLMWKGGGGIDWKNGEHSSIILFGGYEKAGDRGGNIYSRVGLLLEF